MQGRTPDEKDDRRPGSVLDAAVRKMNLLRLTDYFLGSRIDYEQDVVEVAFAEGVPSEQLELLLTSLEEEEYEAALAEDGAGGTTLTVQVNRPETAGSDVITTGQADIGVEVTGDVDVTG